MSNVVLFVRRSTRSNMSKDEKKEMMTAVLLILLFPVIALGTAFHESITDADFGEYHYDCIS